MKTHFGIAALALAGASAFAPASAASCGQDCIDTRTAAEREADAAEIRRLNNEQARYVQERDARYADGWRAYREHPARVAEHRREVAAYEQDRARYEAEMAEWRRAVQLCRQGYYQYCD